MSMSIPLPPLSLPEYRRYGRQMILEGFGLEGQVKLRNAAVVVVGVGGLGCPALQYLAAAGVGKLGVVDHDVVDLSNLQRQVLHTESRMNMAKALSAEIALREINSSITIKPYVTQLTSNNARKILYEYDIILDCTDNVPTRYLLSDTAVALGKPLVSGAAMKLDGQLCIYNLEPDGPCYRCLYPRPPVPTTVKTCEETGVLGVVTGTIGVLQAVECIKLILGLHGNKNSLLVFITEKLPNDLYLCLDKNSTLLIFSALSFPPFRNAKLRKKRPNCPGCGQDRLKTAKIEETDYVAFCGGPAFDYEGMGLEQGLPGHRIRGKELKRIAESEKKQAQILSTTGRFLADVPLLELVSNPEEYLPKNEQKRIVLVCRLGNDSQIAAEALRSLTHSLIVQDLIGGLRSWTREVDSDFPEY
ncbi:hypothetical protein Clacol_002886 [Clathrus columnatus]|uniref:Rhodanese domain-containing protein n=1 Tax=Clathrus columnatus TaxID=1419009 RepID=A0AAV5A5B5_9AGAM|nr:hypothetical protein Clacol_002886 [Clathrus columnatus]